jgi:hypothetical protein
MTKKGGKSTLEHYRKLSVALTDLLAEAHALVNLKSEFGRLPNSTVKTAALKRIEEWFNAEGDEKSRTKAEANIQTDSLTDASYSSQGVGSLSFTDGSAMADGAPNDDDIPF